MDDASKQAVLSAVRSILITVGSVLAARGYIDDGSMQSMVGAVMVIIPILWGIWDKYQVERKAKEREVVAVNAGIRRADATEGPTDLATPAMAKAIIETYAPPPEKPVSMPNA